MHRIARVAVTLSALLFLSLTAKSAYAGPITEDFEISWSGALGNGSAFVVTTEQGPGQWLVTSLTGSQNGMMLQLLAPNVYGVNDNIVVFPANPALLTGFGVATMNSTEMFDIYYNPSAPGITYWECDSNSTDCQAYGDGSQLTSFTVTPNGTPTLPEPSSIVALSSGLIGMFALVGFVRQKRLA